MKKVRVLVVSIICISLIVGYYYYLSAKNTASTEEKVTLTETDKLITKDLKNDYPSTPREVIKFYNRILKCYYDGDYTDEQLEELADQARMLMDNELLENNPRDQFLQSLKADIASYAENSKTISQTSVCGSNDVEYKTIDGDECAYVTASYFVKQKNEFTRTNQQYVLRKDDDGNWKILVFYQVEGDSSNEQ